MSTAERIEEVIATTPEPVQSALRTIASKKALRSGMLQMMERADDIGDPRRALLAGVLLDPASREHLDAHLDEAWAANKPPSVYGEVVVGGGVQAAVYAAARRRRATSSSKPFTPPMVIDSGARVGGTFAVTKNAAWYMNSSNRPGGQGAPGQGGALNLLPGAPLQPFDVCSSEYPSNQVMADVVRLTLALNAYVVPSTNISVISPMSEESEQTDFALKAGLEPVTMAQRVIIATGPGREDNPFEYAMGADRIMTYFDFMRLMDSPFPLRGMSRVAVIGAGDSGKTVIEALLGQGPKAGFSTPGMDHVRSIGWYGIGEGLSEEDFCAGNRSRYRGIGRAFRQTDVDGRRITPLDAADYVEAASDVIYVDGAPYDYAVVCTGYRGIGPSVEGDYTWEPFTSNGTVVANKATNGYQTVGGELGVFQVGVAANLPLSESEERGNTGNIPENSTAIFRYAPRTATLASMFEPSIVTIKVPEPKAAVVRPKGSPSPESTQSGTSTPTTTTATAPMTSSEIRTEPITVKNLKAGDRIIVTNKEGMGALVVGERGTVTSFTTRERFYAKMDDREKGGGGGRGVYVFRPNNAEKIIEPIEYFGFKVGERVEDKKYGLGTVVELPRGLQGEDERVPVRFDQSDGAGYYGDMIYGPNRKELERVQRVPEVDYFGFKVGEKVDTRASKISPSTGTVVLRPTDGSNQLDRERVPVLMDDPKAILGFYGGRTYGFQPELLKRITNPIEYSGFKVGDRVDDEKYGTGTVVERPTAGDKFTDVPVKIDDPGTKPGYYRDGIFSLSPRTLTKLTSEESS